MLTAIGPLAVLALKKLSAIFLAVISTPLGAGAVVAGLFLLWNWSIDNPRVRSEATAGCVARAETAALEAQLDTERKRRAAAEAALADHEQQAAEDAEAAAAAAADLQKRISDYEQKLADAGRGCALSADDLDWLFHNGRKAGRRR